MKLMIRRAPASRAAWLVAAVLQLVLPGAAAWADAQLEAESRSAGAVAHVESHTTARCPRIHPLDCSLCRHLRLEFRGAAPPSATVEFTPPAVPAAVATVSHRLQRLAELPQQRAPPSLL
jgi:hypothetical protein